MSDFSKFKIGSTSYDVKDANAGRTLSVSGTDLSLKNAAGTAISTVTLPGGGGGYTSGKIKLTGTTAASAFSNTALTLDSCIRGDGTSATLIDLYNDYVNEVANIEVEYEVDTASISEIVNGTLTFYKDNYTDIHGLCTIAISNNELIVIKLSGTLSTSVWTGDKISLGGGGGSSTNIYTISTAFQNLSGGTMQSITLNTTLTAAQLRTNMDAGVVRIKDSQGAEVTLLGYNPNGLFFGAGMDTGGSSIRLKMNSSWGTNWEGQVTSL